MWQDATNLWTVTASLLVTLLLLVCAGYFVQLLLLPKFWFQQELLGDTASQEGGREPLSLNLEIALQSPHRTGSHCQPRLLPPRGRSHR
uniref:Uncharacterized protein n=1 Tax=Peromyscus maniculatus bairdii TaxID=230844 RepID=A0A8C8U7B2_PERMB